MESEKEEGIKEGIMKRVEERVNKALKSQGKTLWDLEDEVQEMKNEIGREVMAGMLQIKKR